MLAISITIALLQLNVLAPITLQQAMDAKSVKIELWANPVGTHYSEPLILQLTNTTQTTQNILLENGRTFTPEDTTRQRMLVTREMLMTLAPGETKEFKIQGMCFDHSKSARSKEDKYKVGKMSAGPLQKIARYLQDNNVEGYAAQRSIWAISDNDPLEDIVGWSSDPTEELIKYVATISNRPVPPPPRTDDYQRNLNVRPKVTVGGNFEFGLIAASTDVHIAMFDINNIVVRELYRNKDEKKGLHTFSYEFDATVYTDSVYFIRYLENDEVFMEMKYES